MGGLLAAIVIAVGVMFLSAAYLGVTRSLWLLAFLLAWFAAIVTFGTIIN